MLTLLSMLLWLFLISTLFFILVIIIEIQVQKLSDTNKFKIWWRNNVIGINPYDN